MGKILLFGGTIEGKELALFLEKAQLSAFVSVATEYGKEVLPKMNFCKVIKGRMDDTQMKEWIQVQQIELVLDATHPYAVEVSKNIQRATKETNVSYLRILREECEKQSNAVYVKDQRELINFLNQHQGRVLMTTGSKELSFLKEVVDFQNRIFARVLPLKEVLEECRKNGFLQDHLITGKGPFSTKENVELIQTIHANYLVTKDTGKEGGFLEKAEAAQITGIPFIVIERPKQETGISLKEAFRYLTSRYHISSFSKDGETKSEDK